MGCTSTDGPPLGTSPGPRAAARRGWLRWAAVALGGAGCTAFPSQAEVGRSVEDIRGAPPAERRAAVRALVGRLGRADDAAQDVVAVDGFRAVFRLFEAVEDVRVLEGVHDADVQGGLRTQLCGVLEEVLQRSCAARAAYRTGRLLREAQGCAGLAFVDVAPDQLLRMPCDGGDGAVAPRPK